MAGLWLVYGSWGSVVGLYCDQGDVHVAVGAGGVFAAVVVCVRGCGRVGVRVCGGVCEVGGVGVGVGVCGVCVTMCVRRVHARACVGGHGRLCVWECACAWCPNLCVRLGYVGDVEVWCVQPT